MGLSPILRVLFVEPAARDMQVHGCLCAAGDRQTKLSSVGRTILVSILKIGAPSLSPLTCARHAEINSDAPENSISWCCVVVDRKRYGCGESWQPGERTSPVASLSQPFCHKS